MGRSKLTTWMPRLIGVGLCLLILAGCGDPFAFRKWMYDQAKVEPLEGSEVFEDARGARPLVPGTVARGEARTDDFFYTGLVDGEEVDYMPMEVTSEMLDRGQEQYEIYCAPCHGISGYGNGMVARRGGTPPANYHSDYQIDQPISHYYVVMTNGYRNMWPYATKVSPEDRWAIAAYIRALQLSQSATSDDLPPDQLPQEQLEELPQLEQQGMQE